MSLTVGAVAAFAAGRDIKVPVLQVIDIKGIESNTTAGSRERFRLIVSDGQNFQQAMLSTQLNELVKTQQIIQNSIVSLTEFICNEVQGRRIVIVLGIQVVQQNSPKIGNPVAIGADNKPGQNPAPVHQQQQPPMQPHVNQQQQQQSFGGSGGGNNFQGRGPVARQPGMANPAAQSEDHILPIRALNPYQNKWTIKGRCTSKGAVRTWDKGPNNQGKLFSCEIIDKDDTELRLTFFKQAVDQFFDMIQVDEVYIFSGGQVKMANKQYNSTNNDYEVTMGGNSTVSQVANDSSIKKISLNPMLIANIDPAKTQHADILGVVTEFTDVQEFTSRAGRPLSKVDITLADSSNSSVRCAFWGDQGRSVHEQLTQLPPNQVIGVKNVKVSDYNGCSLSTIMSSNIFVDPDIPETNGLKQWVASGGLSGGLQTRSQSTGGGGNQGPKGVVERYTMASLVEQRLGQGEKPDYVDVKGTITFIKRENMWYPACPEEGINKKVVEQPDGTWYCEQTNKQYPNCEYRYILSVVASDHTGAQWSTAFNETAQGLLGRSADDMERLKQENESLFDQAIMEANFSTYIFRFRVKEEMNNDETRLKCNMVKCMPIDWTSENKQLLAAIDAGGK